MNLSSISTCFISTLGMCDKSYMLQVFLIIKIFLKLICYVLPSIVIIISIISLFKVIQSGKKDDMNDTLKIFARRIIAALIVVFVPTLVNYVFTSLIDGSSVQILACMESATAEKVAVLKAAEDAEAEADRAAQEKADEEAQKAAYEEEHKNDEEKKEIFEEAREKHKNSKNSVSIANGEMFTTETQNIINDHLNDFNYKNFTSVINSYGGFQGYVNELGGVFKKYYGVDVPTVECASDLQEISEYVYGFMYLYGFDYYNGTKYCKWGGECGGNDAASDAFYPSGVKHNNDGLSTPKSDFDKLISGANKINMTTNCNWSVDMVYYKAGLFGGSGQPASSASFRSMGQKYQIITSASDLKVGDIIHFFEHSVTKTDPSTWSDWYHVAYIGEVNKTEGYVVGYDGGSYFTNNKNFKWKANIAEGVLDGTKNWVGVRIADIDQTC